MALPTITAPRAPSQAAGETQLHQEATWCLLMGKTPDPLLGDQVGMQHTTVYCLSILTNRRLLSRPQVGQLLCERENALADVCGLVFNL